MAKKRTRPAVAKSRTRRAKPRREVELREHDRLAGDPEASARLTAGDIDADLARAASAGEETPGGTVATPDQDRVDDIGRALGVPRSPDEEFRTSGEILESRDRNRWDDEDTPGR